MDKDDENYAEMLATRSEYLRVVRGEAVRNGVQVTQWEEEEIELAFEAGFQRGCIVRNRRARAEALN